MGGPALYRREKLARELVRETSQLLLHEIKDPRVRFVTVTRAEVTKDYRNAKIFVSVMGAEKNGRLTLKALHHAHGFIQRELASRIRTRVFPEVEFRIDESIEKTFKMLQTLEKIAKEEGGARSEAAPQDHEEE